MAAFKVAFYDAKGYDRHSFDHAFKTLGEASNFELLYLEPKLTLESVPFCYDCDAICVFVNDDLGADVLAALDEQGINLVLLRCAGFDRVDLVACSQLGITVVRVPAYSPYAVAEFASALLLTLNRKTHKAYNRIRDGNFTLSGLVGFDIHGRTVGIIGTGRIGQCMIEIMLGFGCKVLAFDVFVNEEVRAKKNVRYVSLDELYQNSDIISLHTPLTPDTTHMINRVSINKMKPGVIIINTSRGKLIDSRALVEGLISGRVGGAGLDVYENEAEYFFRDVSDESIEDDVLARLQNMRNVLFTSHQAFLTNEALEAIAKTTVFNLKEFFDEKKRMSEMTNYVAPPRENPALIKALSRRLSAAYSDSAEGGSTA